ncbi:MAG: (Fe-S)-binding protein [Gemmatimonadota bacterium]|nr:(Fe-S)-binding protein [Gemmatimonadota bacterium]MDH3478074.1 (Fe-S)-binding protein [Gemmatimonadota bacterium]MDH3569264.1 (Fe-S)-binding protein [Gemmatimonadota bacterium]MDH5550011.1 (Fe-S)-binding protein [Gemmatimonadota bacterium]
MVWFERLSVAVVLLASVAGFLYVLWSRRLGHVWPKRGELHIVNARGLFTGMWEVFTQKVVLQNRPWVGLFHLPLFFGLLAFLAKSVFHVLHGLGVEVTAPGWYVRALDAIAVAVLASIVLLAIRRYFVDREKLTHLTESGVILGLIALLMITHLLERVFPLVSVAGRVNWWAHYVDLAAFPGVIAYGKHLHLFLAPVNVVLKHMTEVPSDRSVFGNDLDMDLEDESKLEAELARLGMPGGVADFGFGALFDPAACIQCGRCNDACPAGPALKPRDHFVLALQDPSLSAEQLAKLIDPDVTATCVQCRACEVACPTGCRPGRNGLEIRGRLMVDGLYPPRALRETAMKALTSSGNIFGQDESERNRFIRENALPIFDPREHGVLFVLGCQGSNSPEVQPIVLATGRLLDAAKIRWGVLAEERCWGEGLLHGGGLMEDWPLWAQERIAFLSDALGGDQGRTILTICPHCRDTIRTQYAAFGADFSDVQLHTPFLANLVESGKLHLKAHPMDAALHIPCKVVHNSEDTGMRALLQSAGVTLHQPASSAAAFPTACCGGGGGGFLWDSPAKVNQKRWAQIKATGQTAVVTGCPGCHRMLGVVRDENTRIWDVASILADRLDAPAGN